MKESKATRTYLRADCVTFRKTNETFGGLSNMASGYPIRVNGVMILTVEALYQACRFPHRPQVQRMIIGQRSPMTAKMVGKPYRDDSRPDWDRVRVKIMRWCLRLKLATHWTRFSQLLLSTGDRAIVEDSRKDQFWGAVPNDTSTLVGMNVLGRLLMELRESIKEHIELRLVEPPAIPNFLLFEQCMTASDFRTGIRTPAAPDPITRELPTEELALQFSSHVSNSALIARDARDCSSDTVEGRPNLFSGLKPYPSYIKTGNNWFAAMPSSWNFLSLRHIAKLISECGRADLELLSVYLNRGVIRYSESGGQVHKPSLDLSKYQVVRPGNFVLNNQQAWRGSVGVSKYLGIISPAYNVLKLASQIQPSRSYALKL